MKRLTMILALVCCGAGMATEARGEWLVESSYSPSFISGAIVPPIEGANVGAAGIRFSLASASVVQSVEGRLFVSPEGSPGATAILSIFSNGDDNLPNMKLFSDESYIAATPEAEYSNDGRMYGSAWYGGHDLDWVLTAGDYWFVLEPDPISNIRVGVESLYTPNGIHHDFATKGVVTLENGELSEDYRWRMHPDKRQIAMRIFGHSVPEPASATLMAIASVILVSSRRN